MGIFACTWLLPLLVLATLSTGELEFYRDALQENSDDVALKQLVRYLEAQTSHQRSVHHPRFSSLLPAPILKDRYFDYDRQKKHLLQALETSRIADLLRQQEEQRSWSRHARMYNRNEIPLPRSFEPPYYPDNFKLNFFEKPDVEDESSKVADSRYQGEDDSKELAFEEAEMQRGMKEEAVPVFRGGPAMLDVAEEAVQMPAFTFHFGDANLKEKHPFAVEPNDPRYYQHIPFSSDDVSEDLKSTSNSKWRSKTDTVHDAMEGAPETYNVEHKIANGFEQSTAEMLPEQERHTEYHPLAVPVNTTLNSDIYFIAIVAGCSAAAMFALVLISLTWCRLQRGVKAAADIEYPAYGVTGPNKDVSPSGDQRLAQSAQMYHFQHQKQQIIAMENRTSATRDPGSVSEAESDEENEEGDYTVYECPGLASTGEMEVKNPLFHDDPTPATPAQNNKEEDHI